MSKRLHPFPISIKVCPTQSKIFQFQSIIDPSQSEFSAFQSLVDPPQSEISLNQSGVDPPQSLVEPPQSKVDNPCAAFRGVHKKATRRLLPDGFTLQLVTHYCTAVSLVFFSWLRARLFWLFKYLLTYPFFLFSFLQKTYWPWRRISSTASFIKV